MHSLRNRLEKLTKGLLFYLFRKLVKINVYISDNVHGADVVEWSRALDIRLSDWCCSVSMV